MKGSWILALVAVIACVALAMTIYQLWRQEHPQAAKAPQQPCALAVQKQSITVEVKDGKLFVNDKPVGQLPQTEALSVTVVDGKGYVNGKRVWAGKTDRFLLRLPPEGLGPPPPWLGEKEREEFKRDIQKWSPPKRAFQGELDARSKETLDELDRIAQHGEQTARLLKELQERSGPKEKSQAPGRNRAQEWVPQPPAPRWDEESAERAERRLNELLDALERGEESVIPELEEFLQKVDRAR